MNLLGSSGSEESIDFQINLKIAQALADLKRLNAEAGSFPEVIANVNSAMERMAQETGLSLGAVESKFKSVAIQSEKLQQAIQEMANAKKMTFQQLVTAAGADITDPRLNAGQPFGDLGPQAGYKAAAEARRESAALAKEEERSASAIAKDINAQAAAAEKAAIAEKERLKTNLSLEQQAERLVALNYELNKLKFPVQGRDPLTGRFSSKGGFEKQFGAAGDYQSQLTLVESTISTLAQKTGMSFKDVGANLTKTFPELLKDTKLVTVAVENLTKANMGLSASFKAESEGARLVQMELTKLQAAGKLNLTGSNDARVRQLKDIIKSTSAATGAQYSDVANQLEKIGIPAAQANAAVHGLNSELTKGTREAQGFTHGIDVMRTALGTLTAIGLFQFINLITESFLAAIKAARELEDSLFRLSNVERILSQGGADVSLKGLKQGIQDIKNLFPIFSKEDITQLVAQISISTKELGFSEQQILDLAKAVGVLNIRSTEEETATQTAQKVISSLITDNARGIASLGLSFNETTMQAEAMSMGILKAGESVSSLSNEEKAQVKYQILLKNTNGELANMGDYLDSNTAKMKENSAAWHDMLTTWGQLFTALAPATTTLSRILDAAGNMLKVLVVLGTTGTKFITGLNAALWDTEKTLKGAGDAAKEAGKKMLLSLFPQGMEFKAGSLFDRLFGDIFKDMDKETPTNPFAGMAEKAQEEGQKTAEAIKESEEKIIDIMADARDKRAQIDENYRRKIEDANRDHQQKLADIARDVQRKQEDATRNYNQKVEDINRDANEKIAEANQDARQKQIDAEAEYQRRLRELREKFLFDLEDALRERDARQVLRLIRQYQMDKKNLAEKRALDRQEDKKDLAQKLADIERDRQLKLEAARRELAEKQAEIALWAARERADAQLALSRTLADARLWHQRELQEYQQYLQRKLQELAKAIVKEYQLTAAGAQAIYNLLKGYYGTSGSIPTLLSTGLSSSLNRVLSTSSSLTGSGVSPTWSQAGFYGAAEGGTFVATRPTKVLFGEKGPEMASFTPLGRTGADIGKVFGDASVGGQNSISLKVLMSPDLVAEVVDTTLENVAVHIERLNRSK